MKSKSVPQLYHKNPRIISPKRLDDLRAWLEELGDLGGIVHDLNSNEIIGGNQRSKAIDLGVCEIELVQKFRRPDSQGTVALGYVVWEGKRYAYRQVRWTPQQCEKANIVANSAGGAWDWDMLKSEFDLSSLSEWGFNFQSLQEMNEGVQNLRDLLNGGTEQFDPRVEWTGMPEFQQEVSGAIKSLTIHFRSLEDVKNFSDLLGQTITPDTRSLWYPKKERSELLDYVVVSES